MLLVIFNMNFGLRVAYFLNPEAKISKNLASGSGPIFPEAKNLASGRSADEVAVIRESLIEKILRRVLSPD